MLDKNDLKRLILPLMLEQLLAVSVGMVDTFMVSTVGEVAVSGVALVDNINRLVIQIMSAFAAGGIVIASQYYGSNDNEKTQRTCAQIETIMVTAALIIMLLFLPFSRNILGFVFGSIEDDVMDAANTYLLVTAISYPFLALYNAGAGIMRSFGDSRSSMTVSLIMNIINISLNALFVFGYNMGVLGVALATLISRAIAAIIMKAILLSERNPLKVTSLKFYIPAGSYIRKILKIALPNGIENGMFQIGKLLVASMVAALGTNSIAANAIAYQIIDFPNIPGVAVGLALVVVIGQDIGADNKDAAVSDTKRLLRMAYIGDWICKITLFIIAPWLVSIFSLSQNAAEMTVILLRCFSVAALPVWPLSFTMPNALRGAGDVKFTMIVSMASMWLCRIVVSYVLVHFFNMGVLGVWIGMFVDWYIRGTFYTLRFISKKWLNKKAI